MSKKFESGRATAKCITSGTKSNVNQIKHGLNPMTCGKRGNVATRAVQATRHSHPTSAMVIKKIQWMTDQNLNSKDMLKHTLEQTQKLKHGSNTSIRSQSNPKTCMICGDTHQKSVFKCLATRYQSENVKRLVILLANTSGARVKVIHANTAEETAYIEQIESEYSEEQRNINQSTADLSDLSMSVMLKPINKTDPKVLNGYMLICLSLERPTTYTKELILQLMVTFCH